MGKRNTQRKHATMMDGEDSDGGSSVSSSSSSMARSDRMSVTGGEGVQVERDSLLDEALDALYEKRASTREKALVVIIDAFNSSVQHQFVEKKFATLLHQCLSCIKKGSSKEVALASHAIGLLALTVGYEDNAREILKESITPISQALKSISDSSKTVSLLKCLAVVTFVGRNDLGEVERSMQIMWQLVHPKQGMNVVAVKHSSAVVVAVVSAWAFLLTTMDGHALNAKDWQEFISSFSNLLDNDDRSVRIAAGEALAIIFEMGIIEKFAAEPKSSIDASVAQEGNRSREGFSHLQGLKGKILNQVRDLSVEAGGKGSVKKDLNNQRNLFKDILQFLQDGYSPEITAKVGGHSLQTSSWSGLIQLNYLKHFLGGGFAKHIHDNEFLQDTLRFTPKRKLHGLDQLSEKKIYRSPNSALSKARTQFLNKQRMLSEGRNIGHFAVNVGDEDS